ncbi:hypothetical protein EMMF5_002652 [Cystobasidiomycetes sp. EMM_F5]
MAVSKPILVKFVEAIKAQSGVGKIASVRIIGITRGMTWINRPDMHTYLLSVVQVGFCWGGRYTLLLCSDAEGYPSLDAGVANHPSFVSVPDEFKAVNKPVLVQIGDKVCHDPKVSIETEQRLTLRTNVSLTLWDAKDAMLSVDQIQQARDAFKDKPDAEVSLFPGAVHGCK